MLLGFSSQSVRIQSSSVEHEMKPNSIPERMSNQEIMRTLMLQARLPLAARPDRSEINSVYDEQHVIAIIISLLGVGRRCNIYRSTSTWVVCGCCVWWGDISFIIFLPCVNFSFEHDPSYWGSVTFHHCRVRLDIIYVCGVDAARETRWKWSSVIVGMKQTEEVLGGLVVSLAEDVLYSGHTKTCLRGTEMAVGILWEKDLYIKFLGSLAR